MQIDFTLSMKSLEANKNKEILLMTIKKMYMIYIGCPLGNQDKTWLPYKICKKYCLGLHEWPNKRSYFMPLAVLIIWRDPKYHCQDCYFCLIKTKAFLLNREIEKYIPI